MQHANPDIQAQQSWTHRLTVEMTTHAGNAQLERHIDTFLKLYLRDQHGLSVQRQGPLKYGIRLDPGSEYDFQDLKSAIESQLFGPDAQGHVLISEISGRAQTSLDQFRDDIRTIARSMHGNHDLRETMTAFQAELKSVSREFREELSDAVSSINEAAERVEFASALIPDPDRFELLMARNEASTVILERGVRQALELILEAVDAMAARGVLPDRPSLEQRSSETEDDETGNSF